MKRTIDIFSNDVSSIKDQELYKDSFILKYGEDIDADDPFYFDNVDIVDGVTCEVINGIKLEKDTWNQITKQLLKYFHLEL